MADVFISYSREDREPVEALAKLLEAAGLSCWWDRQLSAGTRYLEKTEAELNTAKAVLVVWSRHSIGSHWVADEASVGRDAGKLAPVSLDGSAPPLGFRQFQVIDFSGWTGKADDRVRELVSALTAFAAFDTANVAAAGALSHGISPPQVPAEPVAVRASLPLLERRRVLLAAAGVLTSAGLAGWMALSPQRSVGGVRFRSVAVLPFVDRSPGGGQAFLAEGLAESLLDRLAKNQNLRVPAGTSSFAFRDRDVTAVEIARELKVETVLEGSVAREGDMVRVRAALSDASTGRQIWSETYERDLSQLKDMFLLQDEITAAISHELQAAMGARAARSQPRPANREAWEAFLEGNALMARGNEESAIQAEAAFARTIEADPRFAPAYARRALAVLHSAGGANELDRAKADIAKAFELDRDLPDAILAEAFSAAASPLASPARLERLVAEDPGNIEAQSLLAVLLVMRGRLKDAERPMRVIRELDPFGGDSVNGAIWLLELTGRAQEALKLSERALRLHPFDGRLHQGRIVEYAYSGDFAGFVRAAVEGLEVVPEEPAVRSLARYAFTWAGLDEESLSVALRRLEQMEAWAASDDRKLPPPISPAAAQTLSERDIATYSTLVPTDPQARVATWEAHNRDFPYAQDYFLGPRGFRLFLLAARRDASDRDGARAAEREIREFHEQMDAEGWSGLVADTQKLCFAAVLDDREEVWRRWDAMFAAGAWYLPEPHLTLFDPMRDDPKFQERQRRQRAERAKARLQVKRNGLLDRIHTVIAAQGWSADPKPF